MITEVSPPGWGHTKADKPKGAKVGGTAHAMKLAQKRGDIPKKMNIFALMWSMKNKDDNPHYKPGVKGKLKKKYKGPEGQNEMIDPKKIRNYKNVSNAIVAKADKEAEKVKDKEQKGTLEFPQMPTEESKWSDNFKKQSNKRRGETRRRQQAQQHSPGQRIPPPPQKDEGWGAVAKAADELEAKSKAREDKARNKKVSSWAKKEDMTLAPKKGTKGRKAAQALYQGEDIDMVSLVAQAINELTPEQKKAREASRTHSTLGKGRRLHGGRSAAHPKGAMVSGKTHTYDKPAGAAKKPGRQKIVATPVKKEGIEGDALVKAVLNSPKQQALKRKQDAEKNKVDHTKPVVGYTTKSGKKVYESHFGNILRQAIEEAKKVNAIDTINKIVKTKTMGKLHGQRVDLFTASAIQQVYNALNKKNQAKMVSVMSKDVHGLLKMADFSMRQMKR